MSPQGMPLHETLAQRTSNTVQKTVWSSARSSFLTAARTAGGKFTFLGSSLFVRLPLRPGVVIWCLGRAHAQMPQVPL